MPSTLQKTNQQSPKHTLTDIDDDALSAIIDALMDTDTSFLRVRAVKTLSNLSLTCRQLRRACLPTLLRRCRILVRFNHTSRQHFDLQVASRISPYVQCLRLMIKEPPTRAMHESLRSLVLCFPRLRTLLITECHAGLSLAVVDALLSCATPIEEFVLENVVWDYDPPYNATVAPIVAPLKKYIEHQRNIGHRIDLRGHTDTYMTFFRLDLLRQVRATIEAIEMPAVTDYLEFLASHTWNSMQELILYRGSSVVEDGTLFLPVLRAMPKLRVVKIFLPTDHYRQPRLEICPPEEARSMSITPLREVTIANVAPTDHFFGLLPDDLMVLSIRETPRYYFSRDWWPTYLATPAEFAALFRSRTFTQLQHLEMAFAVVSDDTFDEEQSLYDAMVHSCPNVRSLEVHRYHAPQNSPSLELTLSALKPLGNLRDLRLNLDFPDIPVYPAEPGDPEALASSLVAKAEIVVEYLPWVDTISLLAHPTYREWFEFDASNRLESPSLRRTLRIVRDEYGLGVPDPPL